MVEWANLLNMLQQWFQSYICFCLPPDREQIQGGISEENSPWAWNIDWGEEACIEMFVWQAEELSSE